MTEPVDLDAVLGEHETDKSFTFHGQTFTVPPRLPFYFGVLLAEGKTGEAMRCWLGEKQEAVFRKLNPPGGALDALIEHLYGADPGESPASRDSSRNTSGRSRRTSSSSTGSTSRRNSGPRAAAG